MAKNVVVIGTQWGDEGKGKIVDLLADKADSVVRFQGGHNAGHTIVVNGKKIILHLIPSGALYNNVECLIAHGVVLSITALLKEISALKKLKINLQQRLKISAGCPIILPCHIAIDNAREKNLGKNAIGTTGKGIGPAYEDKIARRSLKIGDLLNMDLFAKKLKNIIEYHNFMLSNYYYQPTIDYQKTLDETIKQVKLIKHMITDVSFIIYKNIANNKNILFEGSQGALLDIDQGTYPFVTSSNTTSAAAATGSGIGISDLNCIIGVVKAYTTRVGNGPFPTELIYDVASDKGDSIGKQIGLLGKEFGATTGRQRRCGWLDMVSLKRTFKANSINSICLTKLDILDNIDNIKVCVAYQIDNKKIVTPPLTIEDYAKIKPIYIDIPGWREKTTGITCFKKLPIKAKNYIAKIEELSNLPVNILSTGADRKQTLIRKHPFI